jgi:hypothetical protein
MVRVKSLNEKENNMKTSNKWNSNENFNEELAVNEATKSFCDIATILSNESEEALWQKDIVEQCHHSFVQAEMWSKGAPLPYDMTPNQLSLCMLDNYQGLCETLHILIEEKDNLPPNAGYKESQNGE